MQSANQRIEPGTVFSIGGLANYQSGSVVSRTLVDRPAGTVTFFAFDEGQGLSEHQAPFDAMVLIVEGSASISIDGKARELKTGDGIVLPANRPHALKASTNFKMLLVMVKQ